jgi:hypothetical protein
MERSSEARLISKPGFHVAASTLVTRSTSGAAKQVLLEELPCTPLVDLALGSRGHRQASSNCLLNRRPS